jgi:hypothetical protein
VRITPVTLLTAAISLLPALAATAEKPSRVRGFVTTTGSGTVSLEEREGGYPIKLNTSNKTAYAYFVSSSLDDIKLQDFVGTAVKMLQTAMTAVEVAIIPENMRAGRISSTAERTGAVATTNMTNGSVAAISGGAASRSLTVTYDGDTKRFQINVPRKAPVVRYVLADNLALSVGSTVTIKVTADDQAYLVTIGSGAIPPI